MGCTVSQALGSSWSVEVWKGTYTATIDCGCVACGVMFISNYIFSTIQRRQTELEKQESTASRVSSSVEPDSLLYGNSFDQPKLFLASPCWLQPVV